MNKKRWSTGGKRYGKKGFWVPFCEDCCYRQAGVCLKSGLKAGVDRYHRVLPAFEKCFLWPRVEAKIFLTRKVFNYTFEGSLKAVYSTQKSFSRTRDPVRYRVGYTYEEFRRRILRLGYRRAWLRWARSGFKAGLRPGVKRRRKTEGYTKENIVLKKKKVTIERMY